MRTSGVCVAWCMVLLVAVAAGAAEPVGNNLSYPAVYTAGEIDQFAWDPPDEPVFGVHYSYGCDLPETVDQFSYPNTSCVLDSDDGVTLPVYLPADECVAVDGPCSGFNVFELDLVYWQKAEDLSWSAETIARTPPVAAAYLDWSDNLESNTWSVSSVIRVETQPFYTSIPGFDPTTTACEDPDPDVCMTGFQMWHASGHGPTEHWGVRMDDGDLTATHEPFAYDSPFAIIHTNSARLNIAKIEKAGAECPTAGGEPPPAFDLSWSTDDDGSGHWKTTSGEYDPCEVDDLEQTVELNVGGKWVYGYNWNTKRMDFDGCKNDGFAKEGWWRLTFYTEDGSVDFGSDPEYWTEDKLAPPPTVTAEPYDPALQEPEESDTDPLYVPEVLTDQDITYLDVCLTVKGGGGGGGGQGGPK